MTYATEKAKFGTEFIYIAKFVFDWCSLSYGVGACNAGQVAGDTAQAGAASSITLSASDTQADNYYNTMVIKITSGTGAGQEKTITDFVNATKVATISGTWTTNPDATSVYTIHNINSSDACYNTRVSCQDYTNYSKTTKTYKFCSANYMPPPGQDMIPAIKSVDFTPTKALPGRLSDLGKVSVVFIDQPHHDRGFDPYFANRTYDAESQGTLFGKLLARNPYFTGRSFILEKQYITKPYADNSESRSYVLDSMPGPTNSKNESTYRAIGHDILSLANDERSQVPEESDGTLSIALSSSETGSLTLDSATDLSKYPTSGGAVRIGDEIITYESRASYVCSTLTRNDWGTGAKAHSVGDSVKICKVWEDENVIDIVHDILTTYSSVDETNIPYDAGLTVPTGTDDEWDEHKDNWYIDHRYTAIISESTGSKKLLEELSWHAQFSLAVNQVTNKVKLIPNMPALANETPTNLNELANFASFKRVTDPSEQLTRVIVNFNKLNHAKDDSQGNYATRLLSPDLILEDGDHYNLKKATQIKSRWFSADDLSLARSLAGRIRGRYADPPVFIEFILAAKDSALWTGDLIQVSSKDHQDLDGSNKVENFRIIEVDEQGEKFKYKAINSAFSGRYIFWAPDSVSADYSSATDEEKRKYLFWSDDTEIMSDGENAYKYV